MKQSKKRILVICAVVLALVILGVGIFLFKGTTQTDPVTGETVEKPGLLDPSAIIDSVKTRSCC